MSRGVDGALAVQHAIEHLDWSIARPPSWELPSAALPWVGFPKRPWPIYLLHFLPRSPLHGTFWLPTPWPGELPFSSSPFAMSFLGNSSQNVILQSPDRVALWIARPLKIFAIFTRPLILLMNGSGNLILRFLGYKPVPGAMVHSVEELSLLIEDTEEAGILDAEQAELLQNIFALTNKKVRDCMVPIEKMGALELNTPLPEFWNMFCQRGTRGCRFTREKSIISWGL